MSFKKEALGAGTTEQQVGCFACVPPGLNHRSPEPQSLEYDLSIARCSPPTKETKTKTQKKAWSGEKQVGGYMHVTVRP